MLSYRLHNKAPRYDEYRRSKYITSILHLIKSWTIGQVNKLARSHAALVAEL